jgi:hexosaminidase
MLKEAAGIFTEIVQQMESNGLNGQERTCSVKANTCGASPYAAVDQQFNIEVTITSDAVQLVTDMDESYTLAVDTKSSITSVYIVAPNFFGARHAMETLSQLIVWDDSANSLVVLSDANIQDRPTFTHRGLSLDTSRSYIDIPILQRIIEALSYNKMNVLHWHILDSHSFPFVSTREPLMAIYGAYSARKVYRPQDIQQLVNYATVRGVKIIPEFDQPSHVGAGWEWGPKYGLGDLTLCFDIQPVQYNQIYVYYPDIHFIYKLCFKMIY